MPTKNVVHEPAAHIIDEDWNVLLCCWNFSKAGALTQAPKFPLKIYSICFYFFVVVVGQTNSIGQEKLYNTHFICFDEIIFPFCFCSIKPESFQNPHPFFCCKK